MKVIPKFLFTDPISISDGGYNQDGVVGQYGVDSAEEIQNRLDSKRYNEYERVIAELSKVVGDYDFKEVFTGYSITDVGNAIRRLKIEINNILSKLETDEARSDTEKRLYGIDTDWLKPGMSSIGAIETSELIQNDSETEVRLEPGFDLEIDPTGTELRIYGGKISLPNGDIFVHTNTGQGVSYLAYDIPTLSYERNSDFVMGTSMMLPADNSNKITVQNGKFVLPNLERNIFIGNRNIGRIFEGIGSGQKDFEYVDMNGLYSKTINIILVSGIVKDEYIDIDSAVNFYMGRSTNVFPTISEAIVNGYSIVVDPTTASGIVNQAAGYSAPTILDGTYYAYYYIPTYNIRSIYVNTSRSEIVMDERDISADGKIEFANDEFPLYILVSNYSPDFNPANSDKLFMLRRRFNATTHSVNYINSNDPLIDVREFKNKQMPVFIPPWSGSRELNNIKVNRCDIHGSKNFMSKNFYPVNVFGRGSITPIILSYDYSQLVDNIIEDQSSLATISNLLTGQYGDYPSIVGFIATVRYNNIVVNDLTTISPNLKLKVTINKRSQEVEMTSSDITNPFKWDTIDKSLLWVFSTSELSFKISLNEDISGITLESFICILAPSYTKRYSTIASGSYKEDLDYYQSTLEGYVGLIKFNSDGSISCNRHINTITNELEDYNRKGIDTAYSIETLISTSITSKPKWFKVVNSDYNQFVAYVSNDNKLFLTRISWNNPTENQTIELLSSYQLIVNDKDLTSVGVDIELNIPEYPTITVITKNSGSNIDYHIVRHDFFKSATSVYTESITSTENIDTTNLLRYTRNREISADYKDIAMSIDYTDSYRAFFMYNGTLTIVSIRPRYYITNYGYAKDQSDEVIVIPTDSVMAENYDWVLVRYENGKTISNIQSHISTTFFCKDNMTLVTLIANKVNQDWVSDYISVGTLAKNDTITDNVDSVAGIIQSTKTILYTRAATENIKWEINPYELTSNPVAAYSLFTSIEYTEPPLYSPGFVLPSLDSWDSNLYFGLEGDTIEKIAKDIADRNDNLRSIINGLYDGKGKAYTLNTFESYPSSISRIIESNKKYLPVTFYGSSDDSSLLSIISHNSDGVGRIFVNRDKNIVVYYPISDTIKNRIGTVVLDADSTITSDHYIGYPDNIENSSIVVEVGNANGSSYNSQKENDDISINAYKDSFLWKTNPDTEIRTLHSTTSMLFSNENIPLSYSSVFQSDTHPFTAFNDAYINMENRSRTAVIASGLMSDFSTLTNMTYITQNYNDCLLSIGYMNEDFGLTRIEYPNSEIVLFRNEKDIPLNDPITFEVEIRSKINNSTYELITSRTCVAKSKEVITRNGIKLYAITIPLGVSLYNNNDYTLAVRVKSGQGFSTIGVKAYPLELHPEFMIRYEVSAPYTNSIQDLGLVLKYGENSFFKPGPKIDNVLQQIKINNSDSNLKVFALSLFSYGIYVHTWNQAHLLYVDNVTELSEVYLKNVPFDATVIDISTINNDAIVFFYSNEHVHCIVEDITTGILLHNETINTGSLGSLLPVFDIRKRVYNDYTYNYVLAVIEGGILKTCSINYSIDQVTMSSTLTTGLILDGFSLSNCVDLKIVPTNEVNSSGEEIICVTYIDNDGSHLKLNSKTGPINLGTWVTNYDDIVISPVSGYGKVLDCVKVRNEVLTLVKGRNIGTRIYKTDGSSVSGGTLVGPDGIEVGFIERTGIANIAQGYGEIYKSVGLPLNPENIPWYNDVYTTGIITNLSRFEDEPVVFGEMSNANLLTRIGTEGTYTPIPFNMNDINIHEVMMGRYKEFGNPYPIMFIDVQNSAFSFSHPLMNRINVDHIAGYTIESEDTIINPKTSKSLETERIERLISVNQKVDTILAERDQSIKRSFVSGSMIGWDKEVLGSDLSKPDGILYTNANEAIKIEYIYNTSGAAIDKINTATYFSSVDTGANYNRYAQETYSYNTSGLLTGTVWSS